MAYKFNAPAGQTIERKLFLCCGNSGTYAAPVWSKIGRRCEDSSAEMDWQEESSKGIYGDTFNTMKTPIMSQSFDPLPLEGDDAWQQHIWDLAVKDQDAAALCNQDLLLVHLYAVDDKGAAFAERYPASMVKPSSLGGEGGGNLGMPTDVTFGGEREVGTATVSADGVITFTKAAAAAEGK